MMSARPVAMMVAFLGLSSCVYPAPEPVPYPYYVAPVSPPPLAYPRCAPGWHWVRGHYSQRGAWIHGHCSRSWVNLRAKRRDQLRRPAAGQDQPSARSWVNPPDTGRDQPPPTAPSPPDAPGAASPKVAPE
jgi:hypothetical protein